MKSSYYNLYTPCNAGILWFNTYHDNYMVTNCQTYDLIQNGKYDKISATTLKALQGNGFIVENDVDEYSNLIQEYHKNLLYSDSAYQNLSDQDHLSQKKSSSFH